MSLVSNYKGEESGTYFTYWKIFKYLLETPRKSIIRTLYIYMYSRIPEKALLIWNNYKQLMLDECYIIKINYVSFSNFFLYKVVYN